MEVLVVGAGISGLAASAFLERKGYDVTVIERSKKLRPFGYTVILFPNGLRVLKELGVSKRIEEKGAKIPGIKIKNSADKTAINLSFNDIERAEGPVIDVGREELHKALRSANKKTKLKMGTTIKSLKQNKKSVLVTFSNGERKRFDFVIGADGINSQIRQIMHPTARKDYSGFTFWVFWSPHIFNFPRNVVAQLGKRKGVIFFPSKSNRKITVFFTLPAKRHSVENPKENVKFLKEHYGDMKGMVSKVLPAIEQNKVEMYHHDDEEEHLRSWYKGRVLLLGDAAHALSPITGMGASMALEDAYVLFEELSNNKNVHEAFRSYVKRRRLRIDRLARFSRVSHKFLTSNIMIHILDVFVFKWMIEFFIKMNILNIVKKRP